MRVRITHLPVMARAVGFALVAVAMIAAVLHFHAQPERDNAHRATSSSVSDPLAAQLRRCEIIAEKAKDNPICEKAWAENRRRFFTYAPSRTPVTRPKTKGR